MEAGMLIGEVASADHTRGAPRSHLEREKERLHAELAIAAIVQDEITRRGQAYQSLQRAFRAERAALEKEATGAITDTPSSRAWLRQNRDKDLRGQAVSEEIAAQRRLRAAARGYGITHPHLLDFVAAQAAETIATKIEEEAAAGRQGGQPRRRRAVSRPSLFDANMNASEENESMAAPSRRRPAPDHPWRYRTNRREKAEEEKEPTAAELRQIEQLAAMAETEAREWDFDL